MMTRYRTFFLLLLLSAGCRQAYEPPAIKAPNHYLLVEGVINAAPDSKTTILLSKTRNLTDTILSNPEPLARIQIESKGGTTYSLAEQTRGTYTIDHLTLNRNESYRLNILTAGGKQYLSDYVPVKLTPPIDSLTWKQQNDVTIYASTHDPLDKARYYRWDFVETWQYHAALMGNFGLGVSNGLIFYRDPSTQQYNCWTTAASTDIVLASSVRLSGDVIDHAPIAFIPQNSGKLGIRYSTLVKQYALTEEAYKYYEILQKNTQQLGGLFDAQPGQLQSNIHSVSDPAEPVIGFVAACLVQEKRLFINGADLTNWNVPVPFVSCQLMTIGQNPVNFQIWDYADTTYQPFYFVTGGIVIAKKDCLDCERKGGSSKKPSFW